MKQWLMSFILLIIFVPAWAEDESPTEGEPSTSENTTESSPADESSSTENMVETPATPKVYVVPNKAKERNDDVIRYLKNFQREDELIEILGKNGNISGLYLPENTGKPQGGVLILHDVDQHAHWPNTVTPIREYLPDYGWNTLSIFFDDYIQKPLPKVKPFVFPEPEAEAPDTPTNEGQEESLQTDNSADASTQNASDEIAESTPDENNTTQPDPNFGNGPEATDPLDEVAGSIESVPDFVPPITQEDLEQPAIPIEQTFIEEMIQRTEDGLNSLNTMGQFNTAIIANGLSANWAAKMLQARLKTNRIGYALILIDPKASEYPEIELNETLAELNIPMLDIITKDTPENIRMSKTRKGAIMRGQNKKYTQLYLPAVKISLNDSDNMISRRIRGWLKTNAAGEEVPVKVKTY